MLKNNENKRQAIVERHLMSVIDRRLWFLFKKAERILNALYLITNHLSENEPLRSSIRKHAVHLFEHVYGFHKSQVKDRQKYNKKITETVHFLVSFFDIARNTKMVSSLNVEMVEGECVSIVELTEELSGLDAHMKHNQNLPSDFFSMYEKEIVQSVKDIDNGHKKTMSVMPKDLIIKDNDINQLNNFNKNDDSKNRRGMILALLKDRGPLIISDILSQIKGCSEKTIQRDLMHFIAQGVVERVGEKRWTKYKITSNEK